MKKTFFLSLLMVLATLNLFSQKYELGKVTLEELNEKVHPKDSSAVAAYLFKKGEVRFEYSQVNGFEMVTTIKAKIKIYKKEGYEWANHQQRFYVAGNSKESVSYDKATTYNVVNGKIQKTKLKSEGEFTEKINKFWNRKKITFPDVKEGSIVEFECVVRSSLFGTIDKWDFQTSIPVNYCEYKTLVPEYYVYNPIQKGYVFPAVTTEKNTKTITLTTKERADVGEVTRTTFSQDQFSYIETKTLFICNDVPALKDEAFVNNIDNYTSSVTYELSMVQFPNEPFKNLSMDWESVVKTIYESESFGPELDKTGYFENDIDALIKDVSSQQERIGLIFDFVKSKVKWNEYYGYFCDDGVRKAYKDMTGNSAEINLMLVAMLRYAKVEANPILVSTRDNGIPIFPNRSAFNYVIAGVELENEVVLLDATDKNSLPNILPIRDLNWFGRIIRKNGTSAEVDLMPKRVSNDVVNLMASISKDAVLEGKIKEQYFDYNAFMHRARYANLAKDNYIELLEKKHDALEVNEYDVVGTKELDKPVAETYSFKHSNIVEVIGDKMYFSPLLFLTMKENPFKQEKREYPVDFAFPTEDRYLLNITIPEGYVVESLPKSVSIPMSDNLIAFKYLVANTDNKIQVSATFDINTPIIPPDYYDELKAVFSEIVKVENEKIVLKKI
ncbi:DUF3857 domain-containing protein [Flavobacterium sp.]|uniref:DUF3857 domain-containing protein n=1 Tax=Flavobacterium sp. TaxID=239 RepID=UPI002B4B6D68|nr:DUF3857 domain-containing protein [Flavobacterium sp.]HLP65620.1 DUF3857 domain-containing protein [Flavobacterium sp.]